MFFEVMNQTSKRSDIGAFSTKPEPPNYKTALILLQLLPPPTTFAAALGAIARYLPLVSTPRACVKRASLQVVLHESFHLSYPFTFFIGDTAYVARFPQFIFVTF